MDGYLKEFDRFNLLKEEKFSDPFNLLEDDKEVDIFTLKNVTQKTMDMPEYIAKRKACKDFEKFEHLFKECHNDLQMQKRVVADFKSERFIKEGLFFILKGVVGYVASVGKTTKTKNKRNARLRCIFENGTESDMLLRSLSAEFYKDGKIISELNSEVENGFNKIIKNDEISGYIYVLKSLSNDESIQNIEDLYKIGYSTTTVKDRVKNAKTEPTYLMADVEVVTSYKTNINAQKLEQLLHQFFGASCLDIKIIGNDAKEHTPREWFIAPLDVIRKAIKLIENEEIIYYRYDKNAQEIILI